MTHCDLRVRWKVASDLRFRAVISEPKTCSFCGISGNLAPSTRKSLAIAIVRFWCAKDFIRPYILMMLEDVTSTWACFHLWARQNFWFFAVVTVLFFSTLVKLYFVWFPYFQDGKSSIKIEFLGRIFLGPGTSGTHTSGYPWCRPWDVRDKALCKAFFCYFRASEWPGCPAIWVGMSQDRIEFPWFLRKFLAANDSLVPVSHNRYRCRCLVWGFFIFLLPFWLLPQYIPGI